MNAHPFLTHRANELVRVPVLVSMLILAMRWTFGSSELLGSFSFQV